MGDDAKENGALRVAAVADLHLHKGREGELRPLFEEMNREADVALFCGDLTNLGLPEEAEAFAADLPALKIPALGVLGNHDHHEARVDEVKQVLGAGGLRMLDDDPFVHEGVGFVGVKGYGGGFGRYMLDAFGESTTKAYANDAVQESLTLERALKRIDAERKVVALHYAPVRETCEGEPAEIFPFLGCSRLAETIDRFEGVRAVFHGHAHHGAPEGRTGRGVAVYNVARHVNEEHVGRAFRVVMV